MLSNASFNTGNATGSHATANHANATAGENRSHSDAWAAMPPASIAAENA